MTSLSYKLWGVIQKYKYSPFNFLCEKVIQNEQWINYLRTKEIYCKIYQNDSFGLVQDGVTEGVSEATKPECGEKFEMGFMRIV